MNYETVIGDKIREMPTVVFAYHYISFYTCYLAIVVCPKYYIYFILKDVRLK